MQIIICNLIGFNSEISSRYKYGNSPSIWNFNNSALNNTKMQGYFDIETSVNTTHHIKIIYREKNIR